MYSFSMFGFVAHTECNKARTKHQVSKLVAGGWDKFRNRTTVTSIILYGLLIVNVFLCPEKYF